jgi:ascorbate-specific PTS system EIIC-type component UlaA
VHAERIRVPCSGVHRFTSAWVVRTAMIFMINVRDESRKTHLSVVVRLATIMDKARALSNANLLALTQTASLILSHRQSIDVLLSENFGLHIDQKNR